MIAITKDKRIVLTLDAGGTKFAFSAIQGNREIIEPVILPANGQQLDLCLQTICQGFETVLAQVHKKAAAISFAFPGRFKKMKYRLIVWKENWRDCSIPPIIVMATYTRSGGQKSGKLSGRSTS